MLFGSRVRAGSSIVLPSTMAVVALPGMSNTPQPTTMLRSSSITGKLRSRTLGM
jgi:hypothetical protein